MLGGQQYWTGAKSPIAKSQKRVRSLVVTFFFFFFCKMAVNPHVPNHNLRLCAARKRHDACYPFTVQLNFWRGHMKLETRKKLGIS